jgi:predicted dehydrogenase
VGKSRAKKIRVGVVGLRRGVGFARAADDIVGMELVALCDAREGKLAEAKAAFAAGGRKISVYSDYDRFLEHDMDAVILANFFHEHAPFAVKALGAGKHVMSETSACFTLAQGVALVEAVEKSGLIYMFAENYPYTAFNQEMRRIFRSGRLGEFVYGEGEYVHPDGADFWNSISPGVNHWRNWLPASYYCTHSMGPMMFITDAWPVKVNGFVMPYRRDDPVWQRRPLRNDAASVIVCRMTGQAVVKLIQYFLRGHNSWVRIHASRGEMENLRVGDTRMLRVRREQYHEKRTGPVERIYLPDFPEHHDQAVRAGHGGGDFFMNYHFARAIRRNVQPWMDVYRGVAMSIVGILAYRSALDDSNTVEVPDFRKKPERDRYRQDDWSPDPTCRRNTDPWPSVLGKIVPTRRQLACARKTWRKVGYTGK